MGLFMVFLRCVRLFSVVFLVVFGQALRQEMRDKVLRERLELGFLR